MVLGMGVSPQQWVPMICVTGSPASGCQAWEDPGWSLGKGGGGGKGEGGGGPRSLLKFVKL